MTIGSRIRQYRRKKDLTQEQLAEYLGITARAVSQWETDRTAPDLSQFPLLCNIFGISSDALLGIEVSSKQKKIQEIDDAAYAVACTGDHKTSLQMWLDGIRQFPDSFQLIGRYIAEVYMYAWRLEDKEQHKERALAYIDRVLADCTDSRIRYETIQIACMWYPKIGMTDRALALAETLPQMTQSEIKRRIYTGTKKHEQWRENIMGDFTNAIGLLSDYACLQDDDGNDIFTDDEKLRLCETQVKMFELFFEKGDYMFHAQFPAGAYSLMARIYASRKDSENALECIRNAAEYAAHFDTYDYEGVQQSLIARGNVPGGIWRHDTHNNTYELLEWLRTNLVFDFLREDPRFGEILKQLEGTAV